MAKKAPSKKEDSQIEDPQIKLEDPQDENRQIVVHAQYLKDLSFESPAAPDCFVEPYENPNVEINVNVASQRVNDDMVEAVLKMKAVSTVKEKTLFVVELTYAGLMSVTGAKEEEVQAIVMIEGPRLLFPFARAILSDMTKEGGFVPFNMQPLDFASLYKNRLGPGTNEGSKTIN